MEIISKQFHCKKKKKQFVLFHKNSHKFMLHFYEFSFNFFDTGLVVVQLLIPILTGEHQSKQIEKFITLDFYKCSYTAFVLTFYASIETAKICRMFDKVHPVRVIKISIIQCLDTVSVGLFKKKKKKTEVQAEGENSVL